MLPIAFPDIAGTGNTGSLFGDVDYGQGVSANSSNQDAATTFALWMGTSEKGQQVIADSLNLIPALKSVTPNWDNVELVNPAVQEDPVKALIEQASAVTDSPRFDTINADMNHALHNALTKVADGTSTPEEATADLQRRTGVRRLTTLTTRPGVRRLVGTASRTRSRLRPNGLPWILPAFVFVVGFLYYAVGYTGYISTLDWDGLSPIAESVGLRNYTDMWADPVFWAALRHTAVFWVGTFVGQTLLGFTFAAILHSGVKFPTLHKVIIFIPTVLAPATMAPVFRLFFAPDGTINDILRGVGLTSLARPWLADAHTALAVLMLITIWQWTGLFFILYYAAMTQIDPELLEAARLDRAGNFRTLWYIVWPGCRGTTVLLAMLSFIGALKTFDIPYLVTDGGPHQATEFLGTYIYRVGIRQAHIGYAAALSVVLLVLAITGAVIIGRMSRTRAGA